MSRRRAVCLAVLLTCSGASVARADGGTVRFSEVLGPYRVTVFTSPTPPRAGDVDVSVLVQDAASGDVRPDVEVTVHARRQGGTGSEVTRQATRSAATNKLYRAAILRLPEAGRWSLVIDVRGPEGEVHAELGLTVSPPLPRWVDQWPWLAWPVLPIGWFLLRRRRGA